MAYITLDQAKQHLSVDWGDEDTYIQSLIDVAIDYLQRQYDLDFAQLEIDNTTLPPTLSHSILLMVSDMYEYRGTTVDSRYSPKTIEAVDKLMYVWLSYDV